MEAFTPDSNLAKPPLPRRKPIETSTSKAGPSVPETTDRNEVNSRNISDSRTYDGFARSTVPISETSPQKISKKEIREAHLLHPVILELVKPDWEAKLDEILQALLENIISKENLTNCFKKNVYKTLLKMIQVAEANINDLSTRLRNEPSEEEKDIQIYEFCAALFKNNLTSVKISTPELGETRSEKMNNSIIISSGVKRFAFDKLELYLKNKYT